MEIGALFNADRDLHLGIVIKRRGLRDASASDFLHKIILIYATYADPQAGFTFLPEVLTRMNQPPSTF